MLLSGCSPPPAGNFCDIAKPDFYSTEAVANYMVENDPVHVRNDIAENTYGAENCKNWGSALPSEGN